MASGDESVRWTRFTPDGSALITCITSNFSATESDVRIWDRRTRSFRISTSGRVAAVSNDGRLLAVGTGRGEVSLWDLSDGNRRAVLQAHAQSVHCLALSPNAQTLASGSEDGTVVLWDVETGEPKTTLAGHDSAVGLVKFTADGGQLLSITQPPEGTYERYLKLHLWHAPRLE